MRTKEEAENHRFNWPSNCPICGGNNVSLEDADYGNITHLEYHCTVCASVWVENYNFANFEIVEVGNDE